MHIQTLEHSDLNLLNELIPPGWEGSITKIDFYLKANHCFPIKVMLDGKIVGVGAAIIHADVAWLAHIITHPNYRNRGIGKLITQSLVDIASSKNCESIYLSATELGEAVYEKLGFEVETEYVAFIGEKVPDIKWDAESIVPYKESFKEQIAAIDMQVTCENRMIELEEHLSSGFVYLEEKKVLGFYLPNLGDGVILATSAIAGQELMKLRLKEETYAAFPIENAIATSFMQQHNFKELRREKRMRLGKKRAWQPTNIYNRIGGNLG